MNSTCTRPHSIVTGASSGIGRAAAPPASALDGLRRKVTQQPARGSLAGQPAS
jgi:NADP-dependent 3-hydroxy acid dehydrogenase YdfG